MSDFTGTYVRVYWNLHKHQFSVMDWERGSPTKGRVLGHRDSIALDTVTFVVQPGGRARVLAEGRKNVHAFMQGTLTAYPRSGDPDEVSWSAMGYNPYQGDTFYANTPDGWDTVPMTHATEVQGDNYAQGGGKSKRPNCWVHNPR